MKTVDNQGRDHVVLDTGSPSGAAGGDLTGTYPNPTIDAEAIAVAKMHASATDVLFGRSTAGAGAGEEITCTAAARSVLDDTTIAAMVDTLGGASSTGTGGLVRATSPTLVTPALGTPASGTLTNCTGLPISTGVSGLGTGVATFLATPSSANLASAVTDETGSGALVFATSPTLVTPALGTPASGVLTNCTGLPQNSVVPTAVVTATDGATVTFDLSSGRKQKVTLGGNRTLALSNDADGMIFTLELIQDATGSRTVTWFSGISWPGATVPTLTTTANKKDRFVFIRTGSGAYEGFTVGQNI